MAQVRFERRAGDTEVSYFLPSRENGVNDMYIHLGFSSPDVMLRRSRVALVWAILRLRHPLIASSVEMHNYEDIRFIYRPPLSAVDALEDANEHLEYRNQDKADLIEEFLNGPRMLSNNRLIHLIIIPAGPPSPSPDSGNGAGNGKHALFLCGTHFLADGMSMHSFCNELFILLASDKTEADLLSLLEAECLDGLNKRMITSSCIPLSVEERLPVAPASKLSQLAARVDFLNVQRKQIGGHTFPRRVGHQRHTIVPTVSVDEERTRRMLEICKSHGVSMTAALFALCNYAWAKMNKDKKEMPIMMYSAINLRPYLLPSPTASYMFISIGYFNVILPSFFPGDTSDLPLWRQTFWHRAQMAKRQSAKAMKGNMVASRSRLMASERGSRARYFAKEDDDKVREVHRQQPVVLPPSPPTTPLEAKKPSPIVPSAALLGVSLLGNLDAIYSNSAYPTVEFHTLQNGVRQRPGGMLMFGYTFVRKLHVSLGYDENGFDKAVVDEFWKWILRGMDDMLVD